ncbi:type II secretion system F family protein [Cellulomonas sp. RIT-PI-Y]|uniref:type II secretion system F family protein n=1 Tax=Cellulomonas sp. RIT-PI-Y TaxID=3035297 RepID=UPI0021D92BC4|nr:type II secretion system F family protein [Cellulomonas sp. RIT-PI-Y]
MATTQAQTYEYTVLGKDGQPLTGRIEAPNEQAVAARLRELGLSATDITPVSTGGLNREISIGSQRPKPKDVALALRQLATMVEAGLSLPRALSVLRMQTEGQPLAAILEPVEQDVTDGLELSVALAKHPRVFTPVTLAMVRAGEAGGFLAESLTAVSTILERDLALRQAVKGAMVYPVVILVMAVVAVTAMLLFIVPVFEGIFADVGAELPWATQLLVKAAALLRITGIPLMLAIGGGIWWWRRHGNDLSVREKIDPLKLRAPIFGPLQQKVGMARFARNLSTMTRVGVPIVPALETVGGTAGNVVIEQAVDRVREAVRTGTTLAAAIEDEDIFPTMLRQMVAVGEDSGSLDVMLTKVADFYDAEVDAAAGALSSVIEPLMIVFIGVIVGAMLIALYMPIFSISDTVQ